MKRVNALSLIIILAILVATLLATACGSEPAAPAPTSTATATASVPSPTRYLSRLSFQANRKRWGPIMVLLKRLGQVFVTIIGLSIATTHFGLNITLGSTVLLFLAVVVAIGARAAIADATSGFIILTDRPFQVGDDILIKELDSWGTVLEIGIRSTRLRTLDNRQVIIPNSQIGQSQVINYSSPEPSFRAKTDIGVVYGTEFDQLERVITAAVRRVEGVLPDKPVDVFFLAFGDSARQIRVWWWIDSVNNLYPILTRVNATLQTALNDAGIEIPFPIYNLNLKTEAEHDGRATQALSDQSRKEEPI